MLVRHGVHGFSRECRGDKEVAGIHLDGNFEPVEELDVLLLELNGEDLSFEDLLEGGFLQDARLQTWRWCKKREYSETSLIRHLNNPTII